MEHAVYMAKMFHELDPVTPVTIGAAFSDNDRSRSLPTNASDEPESKPHLLQ
jgi:hypothetical protein